MLSYPLKKEYRYSKLRIKWNEFTGDEKEVDSLKAYKTQLEKELEPAVERLLIVRLISSYEFSRQHTERAYDENIFSLEVYPFFFCS